MSLVVNKDVGETWRQAVERLAARHGLLEECLTIFDREVKNGIASDHAAWHALYEWDCLDYEPDR